MPLQKLQFRPGIVRELTSYSNEGGWHDGDRIRFRYGYPESIRGWVKLSTQAFLGTCRALWPWVSLDGNSFLGIGTHLKYYISEGGIHYDVTPLRLTTAPGAVTFAAAANTLAADVNAADLSITLTDASAFPPSGLVQINSEQIRYGSLSGNVLSDLTRGENGTTAADHSSSDVVGCATLEVTHSSHGAVEGDFVTYSSATGLGDQITADRLNQEYQVVTVLDTSTYLIEARTAVLLANIVTSSGLSPTPVFATSSDTGSGGSGTVAAYQINVGLDTTISGTGWGAGGWGRGGWGSAAETETSGASLRFWSHDNYGEDLLMNVRDGAIYYWDRSGGTNTRAVNLTSLSGASKVPTVAKRILVAEQNRHVIAFGCDSETNPGVQDPLLIRFSDQDSLVDWEAKVTNTAGDLRLGSGSEIVTVIETRQQILVFTDTSLYAMQYLGPPFTFGVNLISQNIGVISPLSAVAVDDGVFWMGPSGFYVYQGSVQPLPCAVRRYVYDDINVSQSDKVCAALNNEQTEVWWFYPSAESEENDRYVVYNFAENIWYYGNLGRTFWIDEGLEADPIAASTDHFLYRHETGFNDGSTDPESPLGSYVVSSPLDIGDGEQFTMIRRMLPDMSFRNSTAALPAVTITSRVRNFPGGDFFRSVESTVTSETEKVNLRMRGRQISVRIGCDELDVSWRLGALRYDIQPDGKR